MAQLLIRNLTEETIKNLKTRAKFHHRSLQGEVKLILEEYSRHTSEPATMIAEKWQEYFTKQKFSDSAELIRQDRDR